MCVCLCKCNYTCLMWYFGLGSFVFLVCVFKFPWVGLNCKSDVFLQSLDHFQQREGLRGVVGHKAVTLKANINMEGPLDVFYISQGRVLNFTMNSESLTKVNIINISINISGSPSLLGHNKGLYFSSLLNLGMFRWWKMNKKSFMSLPGRNM